jgi:hypothetical protein
MRRAIAVAILAAMIVMASVGISAAHSQPTRSEFRNWPPTYFQLRTIAHMRALGIPRECTQYFEDGGIFVNAVWDHDGPDGKGPKRGYWKCSR